MKDMYTLESLEDSLNGLSVQDMESVKGVSEINQKQRKISHRKINLIVHDNGEICAKSFNRICPHQDSHDAEDDDSGKGGQFMDGLISNFAHRFNGMRAFQMGNGLNLGDGMSGFGDGSFYGMPNMGDGIPGMQSFGGAFQGNYFGDDMFNAMQNFSGDGFGGMDQFSMGGGYGMSEGGQYGMPSFPGMHNFNNGGFTGMEFGGGGGIDQFGEPLGGGRGGGGGYRGSLAQYLEAMVKSRQEQQLKDGENGENALDSQGRPYPDDFSRLTDQLDKIKNLKREREAQREHLVKKAKLFQARASRHMTQSSPIWEEKLQQERTKTDNLEEVCSTLRDELDQQNLKRLESFEVKMKPIIIKDGPSKKANFKIQAAKIQYDIYALSQRLRLTTIRCEHEENIRSRVESEVRRLRDKISDLKIHISTITKGIPMSKIELRDDKRSKKSESAPGTSVSTAKHSATTTPTFPLVQRHNIEIQKSQQNNATQILN